MLYEGVWVFTWRHFSVIIQRFGTTCLSHFQRFELIQVIMDYLESLKMAQTSSPEKLVSHRKITPGKTSEAFIQHLVLYIKHRNRPIWVTWKHAKEHRPLFLGMKLVTRFCSNDLALQFCVRAIVQPTFTQVKRFCFNSDTPRLT